MRTVVLVLALLALGAMPAFAAPGVNLNWGTGCWKDGGIPNLSWACNTNVGTAATLTVSFVPPAHHDDFLSASVYMEGMADGGSGVPDWWRLEAGGCRDGSLALNTDFTHLTTSCTDPWEGGGVGDIGEYSESSDRLHLYAVWIPDLPMTIDPGVEYTCAQFVVSAAKTTGTGACTGCTKPVIWAISRVELGYMAGPTDFLISPVQNQCVTWQNSTLSCAIVPARAMSWGRLKSLYR